MTLHLFPLVLILHQELVVPFAYIFIVNNIKKKFIAIL